MAWERRLWEDLIYFARAEKLWENCPIHPANSAFRGAGKKCCLSKVYGVRTTSVSICGTAVKKYIITSAEIETLGCSPIWRVHVPFQK